MIIKALTVEIQSEHTESEEVSGLWLSTTSDVHGDLCCKHPLSLYMFPCCFTVCGWLDYISWDLNDC